MGLNTFIFNAFLLVERFKKIDSEKEFDNKKSGRFSSPAAHAICDGKRFLSHNHFLNVVPHMYDIDTCIGQRHGGSVAGIDKLPGKGVNLINLPAILDMQSVVYCVDAYILILKRLHTAIDALDDVREIRPILGFSVGLPTVDRYI